MQCVEYTAGGHLRYNRIGRCACGSGDYSNQHCQRGSCRTVAGLSDADICVNILPDPIFDGLQKINYNCKRNSGTQMGAAEVI